MTDAAVAFDQNETDAISSEISDEALEAAARTPRQNGAAYTVVMCTGGIECPY